MVTNGSATATLEETPATEASDSEKTRGTVTRNPRIVAISKISNILDGLDETSRGVAVRFIAEEYGSFLE